MRLSAWNLSDEYRDANEPQRILMLHLIQVNDVSRLPQKKSQLINFLKKAVKFPFDKKMFTFHTILRSWNHNTTLIDSQTFHVSLHLTFSPWHLTSPLWSIQKQAKVHKQCFVHSCLHLLAHFCVRRKQKKNGK